MNRNIGTAFDKTSTLLRTRYTFGHVCLHLIKSLLLFTFADECFGEQGNFFVAAAGHGHRLQRPRCGDDGAAENSSRTDRIMRGLTTIWQKDIQATRLRDRHRASVDHGQTMITASQVVCGCKERRRILSITYAASTPFAISLDAWFT